MNEDEPFLKRWSRRKVEAREGPDKVEPACESKDGDVGMPGDVSLPAQGEGRPQDKRELTETDFADVDFDALDAKSDYARFLAKGVPEAIKQKALRKLWASDPVFSQIEPLQEYAGDFTDAAVAVPAGTLKTAYRVGKGFLSDEEVAAWEKLGHPEEPTTATAVTPPAASDVPPSPPRASAGAVAATAGDAEPAVVIAVESADQPELHARAQARQPNPHGTGGGSQIRGRARPALGDRRTPARGARPLPPPRLHRARPLRHLPARPAQHVFREMDRVRRALFGEPTTSAAANHNIGSHLPDDLAVLQELGHLGPQLLEEGVLHVPG